ncbi:MAG: hypothetical protein WBA54_14615 [Acidaminobacteraceae bacterium]
MSTVILLVAIGAYLLFMFKNKKSCCGGSVKKTIENEFEKKSCCR